MTVVAALEAVALVAVVLAFLIYTRAREREAAEERRQFADRIQRPDQLPAREAVAFVEPAPREDDQLSMVGKIRISEALRDRRWRSTTDYIGKLDEKYRQAKSARRLLEPQWFMSLAFFQNKQWLAFMGDRLVEPRGLDDPGRITETENRITGIIRTELAKLTKTRPVWVSTPQSGDDEDMNAAGLSEDIMRYQWGNLGMRKHDLKALEWSRITGSGFLRVTWDPTIGDPIDVLVRPDGGLMSRRDRQADARGSAGRAGVRGDDRRAGREQADRPGRPEDRGAVPVRDVHRPAVRHLRGRRMADRGVDQIGRLRQAPLRRHPEARRDREPRPRRDAADGRDRRPAARRTRA